MFRINLTILEEKKIDDLEIFTLTNDNALIECTHDDDALFRTCFENAQNLTNLTWKLLGSFASSSWLRSY